MSIPKEEKIDNPLQEMSMLAHTYLDLKQWGFTERVRQNLKSPIIIYNSEWCRIKLFWDGWDYSTGYTMDIFYGRLHAPDDQVTMIWQGEECYCWHRVEPALHFIDSTSPENAAKMLYRSHIIHQFRQSQLGQSLGKQRRQPEWLTRAHAAIWEHYGQRLFELFDLRRADLWEEYQRFTTEVFKIKGKIKHIKPPQDQIC